MFRHCYSATAPEDFTVHVSNFIVFLNSDVNCSRFLKFQLTLLKF